MSDEFIWISKFPKIELHAHLFGSITKKQLCDLLEEKNMHSEAANFNQICQNLDFDSIFKQAFSYLPKIIKTKPDLVKIIDLVIGNFIADGVVYLELRSSPKKLENLNFKEYFETIIDRIKHFEGKITTRYIVSVNRDQPAFVYNDLIEIVQSVPEYKQYILGFDFSGNSQINHFSMFKHLFENARAAGFKITLHTPELPDREEELTAILEFLPERIGHMLYYKNAQIQFVVEKKIPIEICPTSNSILKKGLGHNFNDLIKDGVELYTICTDDWLLIHQSLSEEIILFQKESQLSQQKLLLSFMRAADFIFDENYKPVLKEKLRQAINKLGVEIIEN